VKENEKGEHGASDSLVPSAGPLLSTIRCFVLFSCFPAWMELSRAPRALGLLAATGCLAAEGGGGPGGDGGPGGGGGGGI
jgi:hypothetical protein